MPPDVAESAALIGADSAWTSGYNGAGRTVAVLDTGVDKSHSICRVGAVVAEACYSDAGRISRADKPVSRLCH